MKAKRKGTNISFTENVLKHSIVRVISAFTEENLRIGRSLINTGFFVESDLILTNLQAVAGAWSIYVDNASTNTEFPIEEVVAWDFNHNLVLLKVAGEGKPIPIGDSDTVVIGNVLSVFEQIAEKRPVTQRVRIHEINNTEKRLLFKEVFKPGQCGSPLLNVSGEVIGMAVLGTMDVPVIGNQSDINWGYAIPANVFASLLSCKQDVVTLEEWLNQPLIRSYHTVFKAQGLLLTQNINLALEQFDIAIKMNPEFSVAYCGRAAAYIVNGKLKKAISDCDCAIKLNPDYVDAYFNRASAYMLLTRFSKGLADCDAALKLRPDHFQASLLKAFAYLSLENYEEALTQYDRALSIDDKSAEVYFYRGEARYQLNDFQGTIDDFSKGIRLSQHSSMNESVYQRRGDAKHALGDYVGAIKDYNQSLQDFPLNDASYNSRGLSKNSLANSETRMGRIKFATKLFKEAVEDFTEAINLDPITEGYWNNRAISRKCLKDYEGALKDCDEAIKLNSDYFPTYVNRGSIKIMIAEGKTEEEAVELYNESIEDYTTALALNQKQSAVYSSRGLAYFLLGSKMEQKEDYTNCIKYYQNAIEDQTHAIELNPKDSVSYNYRSCCRIALGKLETNKVNNNIASNLLQDALHDSNVAIQIQIQMEKPFSSFYFTRAAIYEELEEHNKAIEDYNEAIRLDPKNASFFFKRGLAKKEIGELDQAEEDFATAKKLAPDIERKIN